MLHRLKYFAMVIFGDNKNHKTKSTDCRKNLSNVEILKAEELQDKMASRKSEKNQPILHRTEEGVSLEPQAHSKVNSPSNLMIPFGSSFENPVEKKILLHLKTSSYHLSCTIIQVRSQKIMIYN